MIFTFIYDKKMWDAFVGDFGGAKQMRRDKWTGCKKWFGVEWLGSV